MVKRKNLFNGEGDLEIIEALRTLRTNLSFLNEKEVGRKILFTSVIPNEGKSFLSSNYAASVASTGKKALLIDCDIRRPRAHESFGVKFKNGLESVILGKVSVEDVILKDVIPNLDILPSKHITDGVTELFSSDKIDEILDSLSPHYNTIVLDNPPIAVASDSVLLSKFVDGVVVVVGYDQVAKKELEFAREMLGNAHANIYGFVVNKVDKSGLSYGNYGYYNNYYSYYKEYYEDGTVRTSQEHRHKKMTKFEKLVHRFKKEYKKQITGDLKGRRK
ncbi:CpsD/CapB family tyrosine-protein kinase [Fusobacterium sp. IOR10]|uniref:CpsD/CapB family tyrosine-protein kinase n=1 Tax=Fusobacterium sp. IOR10 TaxID=2665157 RepID=UPI0013D50088|nr:CpsD/CapB family tyrosine-protein kinase [Fusobacterium sp. IOR10]